MPYIDLLIHPPPQPEQAAALAAGITDAVAGILGKRRELTAVRVAQDTGAHWSIGGVPSHRPTAYLDLKITAGTNTAAEKARLLHRLHALLAETLGDLAEASYLVIHELPADSWGYAGITQAARQGSST